MYNTINLYISVDKVEENWVEKEQVSTSASKS